jgi:hypothetical protein
MVKQKRAALILFRLPLVIYFNRSAFAEPAGIALAAALFIDY